MTLALGPRKEIFLRHTHVKYERSVTSHSNVIATVKVFVDKQTNGLTDRAKAIMLPICLCWAIKMVDASIRFIEQLFHRAWPTHLNNAIFG